MNPGETLISRSAACARTGRINIRLVVFLAVLSVPFAAFGYVYLNSVLTGGIERHDGYDLVDLKAMGNFHFHASRGRLSDVPERFRALEGKRVVLEGFMFNSSVNSGRYTSDFELVYNIQLCCFGGPPLVQERVYAHIPDGRAAYDSSRLMRVTGVLHVAPRQEAEGPVLTLYTLEVERIGPVS